MNTAKSALLAGATGLVGRYLLHELLDSPDYGRVVVIGRRSVGFSHPRLVEHLVGFERLEECASLFRVDAVFCCLGTTLKKAGSKENFRKVDFTYCRNLAALAKRQLVPEFHLVSALGADPASTFFYTRVKGETEQALREMQFSRLCLYRISLLLGERDDRRPVEALAALLAGMLSPVLVGGLRKYRPVRADALATAMRRCSLQDFSGERIVEPEEIKALVYGKD